VGHPAHAEHRGPEHRRHHPEETALYRIVEASWPEFRERANEAGGLPRFVTREIDDYLGCGILERGCLVVVCERCGFERLVAFSCKRRGFCPSCLGRRMNDLAIHLVEAVLPEVPIRQWVCSVPWKLRYLLGYDRELCAEVLGAFVSELRRSMRWRAKRELGLSSVDDALTGAITVVQRFDSALRLNVHYHTLALDGVYVRADGDGPLAFHALAAPTTAVVADVARRTAERVRALLERRGRALDAEDEALDPLEDKEPLLARCYGAAVRGIALLGEKKAPERLTRPTDMQKDELLAEVMGFNVHAKVVVDGRDRPRLERIVRYLARPPIAQDRLELTPDGRVRYTMKKAWRDGTHALLFEPLDLLGRLCAMVPPPRVHMIRFHGVLAPHAAARAEIVPRRADEPAPARSLTPPDAQLGLFEEGDDSEGTKVSRKPWAFLLRHVFKKDVTLCPECGGDMRWLEVARTPEAAAKLLADRGLGPRAPPAPAPTPLGQLRLPFKK